VLERVPVHSITRKALVFLIKEGMCVQDAFTGHLILDTRPVIHALTTDLVLIMTSLFAHVLMQWLTK
jgi:hypothetical protein